MNRKPLSVIRLLSRLILSSCLAIIAFHSASLHTVQASYGIWTAIQSMNYGRFGHTATLLEDGAVLIAGGTMDGNIGISTETPEPPPTPSDFSVAETAELYIPTDEASPWSLTAYLNEPRVFHTATLIAGDRVLVAGGTNASSTEGLASAEIYDPTGGPEGVPVWLPAPDMPNIHVSGTATLLADGKVLVVGGYTGSIESGTATDAVDIFDPNGGAGPTGSWSSGAHLLEARVYHTAALLPDGKVLVTGGTTGAMFGSGEILGSAEIYDPDTNTWTEAQPLLQARADHTATLLPDGQVLVAGGYNPPPDGGEGEEIPEPYLASAELYDPEANSWKSTGSLSVPRGYHTATLLDYSSQAGKVLVTGGSNSTSAVILAELFNPSTGEWADAGTIQDPYGGRVSHTTTLLPNGKVLAAGGYLGVGTNGFLADENAELYAPKIPQTIEITTHAPISAQYQSTFTVEASANSGLEVTYGSNSPDVCTNSGAEFTMTKGTGTCVVIYAQEGDDVYSPTQAVETVNAKKISQTISITQHAPDEAPYRGTFQVAASASSSLPVVFTTAKPAGICSASVDGVFTMIKGTGDCLVYYDQPGDDNYLPATQLTETVIAQRIGQTITFNPPDEGHPYGTDFTVSASSISLLEISFTADGEENCAVEETTQDEEDPSIWSATIRPTGIGECILTASQAGDGNYNAAEPVERPVTMIKGDQTIHVSVNAPVSAAYQSTFTVAAAASSGLGVIYATGSPQVCENDGGKFTMIVGMGTCIVRYNQPGNDFYNPAPQKSNVVTAEKAAQTITFGTLPDEVIFGDDDFIVSAASDSKLPVKLALGPSSTCTLMGDSIHIDHAGFCTLEATQEGNDNIAPADPVVVTVPILKKTIGITLENTVQTIGNRPLMMKATPEVSGIPVIVVYTGLGELNYGPTTSAPTGVGSYTVVATIDHPDYQGTVTGTLIINPALIFLPTVSR